MCLTHDEVVGLPQNPERVSGCLGVTSTPPGSPSDFCGDADSPLSPQISGVGMSGAK